MLRIQIAPRSMVLAVVVVAGSWLLLHLLPVLLIVVAALFIVGTLNPGVEWLEARGLRRALAIGALFAAMLIATLLVLTLTGPPLVDQATTLIKEEPVLRYRLADFLSQSRLGQPLAESLRSVRYDAAARGATTALLSYSEQIVEIVAGTLSAVFLALYVMLDRDRLRGGLFAVVPRQHHVRLSRVLLKLETIVGGYIRGQVLTSALMAGFVFALLSLCRAPDALALAVLAGVADVLPYVGVFLSVGPAVVAALSKGPGIAMIVLVAMLAYEELESRILVPRIYGRALRLPSSIVLFALLAGTTLLGILGALLALPVASAVLMLVEELRLELPGEPLGGSSVRSRDLRAEAEYERRTEGVPAEKAAAIAVEIAEQVSQVPKSAGTV